MEEIAPLKPTADVPEVQRGDWFSIPDGDELSEYLSDTLWELPDLTQRWQFARLSHAAYLYREVGTGWTVVAKFYAVKTSSNAQRYASRELDLTLGANNKLANEGRFRVVKPLAVWRGVLFLEYVDGLTLEDEIAVRRSRPGILSDRLVKIGEFLAGLHAVVDPQDYEIPAFDGKLSYAHEIIDNLARHGVLQDDPVTREGLDRLIDRWDRFAPMREFKPALSHGDATTSNFIYPWEGGMVAIDWERSAPADPAADLGRLKAEVMHSLKEHGGSAAEALPFLERLQAVYLSALPADYNFRDLELRVPFYQALSTLRIARNGWVSRLHRTALVAQASALLSSLS